MGPATARPFVHRSKLIPLTAAFVLAVSMLGALPRASGEEPHPALGETRLFARVPHPGSGGVLVDGDTVWTPALGFMDAEIDQWPVWAYDRLTGREQVDKTFSIERPGPAVMAMRGMARDAQGRLYLVDMNGRVMRTAMPSPGGRQTVEVYATIPTHGNGATYIPWAGVSMPADITFDGAGNAYIPDVNFPAIWRVPPGGGEAHLPIPANAQQRAITAFMFRYYPPSVDIASGDSLVFFETDPLAGEGHSVTHAAPPGERLFNSGIVPPGGSGEVTGVAELPTGSYPITCLVHAYMTGTLQVGGAS